MVICFRDRTYCGSPNCQNKCGRKLTDADKEAAKKWWLNVTNGEDDGAPIAYMNFCDEDGEYIRE